MSHRASILSYEAQLRYLKEKWSLERQWMLSYRRSMTRSYLVRWLSSRLWEGNWQASRLESYRCRNIHVGHRRTALCSISTNKISTSSLRKISAKNSVNSLSSSEAVICSRVFHCLLSYQSPVTSSRRSTSSVNKYYRLERCQRGSTSSERVIAKLASMLSGPAE